MSGAAPLIQMNALGPQDTYLTSQPTSSFFKYGYAKHTPFAMESVRTNFMATPAFGGRSTAILPRRGDLITRTYLAIELSEVPRASYTPAGGDYNASYWCWADKAGLACVESITLEIGGTTIDAHPSEFLDIWDELSAKSTKPVGPLIGTYGADADGRRDAALAPQVLHVPLQFFFSRALNKGVPVTALQRQEVRVYVQFRPRSRVLEAVGSPGALQETAGPVARINDAYLLSNVAWLEPAEKASLLRPYDLLIDTLQTYQYLIPKGSTGFTASLDWLSHPVRELIFVFREGEGYSQTPAGLFDYSLYDTNDFEVRDPFTSVTLYIQNQERFGPWSAQYCRTVTNYEAHTNTPDRAIYTLPFALDPESNVPSGSCNMSVLSNTFLKFALKSAAFQKDVELLIFARSHNVVSFGDGYATLRFAN